MKIALLLALPLAAAPLFRSSAQAPPTSQAAAVRDELTAVYAEWSRARTSFDTAAFERLLAPDFWVEIGPERLTRAQFIEQISARSPAAALTRFDARILTLRQEGGAWYAVITEKLEVEGAGADGKARRACSLWVTKDGFKKDGERWTILSSEAIGWENWGGGEEPPFDDWSS
jgi:hypothetical protein